MDLVMVVGEDEDLEPPGGEGLDLLGPAVQLLGAVDAGVREVVRDLASLSDVRVSIFLEEARARPIGSRLFGLQTLRAGKVCQMVKILEVATVRPMQCLFAHCLQQDDLVFYSSAVQFQLDVESFVLGLGPLRFVEDRLSNEAAFSAVVLDKENHRPFLFNRARLAMTSP